MELRRRLGRFEIDCRLIDENPGLVMDIMGKCIPVRAEMHFIGPYIEYMAISEYFSEVPEVCIVPMYKILYEKDKDGITKWMFWLKE